MKILLIVPAYNEGMNIQKVITSLQKELPEADILVINDGSEDDTSLQARQERVLVVDLPFNLGIGGAMQTGYQYALQNQYTIAVQVDGDGQHPADQVRKLIEVVACQEADLASGSRFLNPTKYKTSKSRKAGIFLFAKLLSWILGQRVTDATSGFRAINAKGVALFSHRYPEDYPEVEALLLVSRYGLTFKEIPIEMQARVGGHSSITPIYSLYYMIKVTLAILVGLLRRTA